MFEKVPSYFEKISRYYAIVSRLFEKEPCYFGKVSRYYEKVSRLFEKVSRYLEKVSRHYEMVYRLFEKAPGDGFRYNEMKTARVVIGPIIFTLLEASTNHCNLSLIPNTDLKDCSCSFVVSYGSSTILFFAI